MDFEKARFNMIEQQIRPWDVHHPDVLLALHEVKREDFVPAEYRNIALCDVELPLPEQQIMLFPRVEARVLQALNIQPTDRVLEIGTGSGYMTALLARRAKHVTSIEIRPTLLAMARKNLAAQGVKNVDLIEGCGVRKWTDGAPYDVICVNGAMPAMYQPWIDQLGVGGRLVMFVGEVPVMAAKLVTRPSSQVVETEHLFETVVPMLDNAPEVSHFRF
jgi:protein-L-isoaspartate(D-aspartate) O-methyltransferase